MAFVVLAVHLLNAAASRWICSMWFKSCPAAVSICSFKETMPRSGLVSGALQIGLGNALTRMNGAVMTSELQK